MLSHQIDHTLHLIVNAEEWRGQSLVRLVSEAVAGGTSVVQLRSKELDTAEFLDQADALARALDGSGVPLVIDDRVDVALACGAAGVHLGQRDLPLPAARRLLGVERVIGATLTSEARRPSFPTTAADYYGVGPVFPTRSKRNAPVPMGVPLLREIVERLGAHSSVAIGGITLASVPDIMAAGASGIAVISAICEAGNPRHAARLLSGAVRSAARARRQ